MDFFKRFTLENVRSLIFPSKEEYNFTEAKKLVDSLMSKFEIEEQTEMLYQTHIELLEKRRVQIIEADKQAERLKLDYDRLKSIFISQ